MTITLLAYDPVWPQHFDAEKSRILAVIGHIASVIEHVGSTSIPGLPSKPTIDILIGLSDFALADSCIEPLRTLGYGCLGENGIQGRYFFRKPDTELWDERQFNLHMTQQGSREWQRMIVFRDYLRTHPDAVREYHDLKQTLAAKHAGDVRAYAAAKTEFVEGILKKATQLE